MDTHTSFIQPVFVRCSDAVVARALLLGCRNNQVVGTLQFVMGHDVERIVGKWRAVLEPFDAGYGIASDAHFELDLSAFGDRDVAQRRQNLRDT